MKLDSLNIRKGLELEIDVSDIFKIDISSSGDFLAKEIYEIGVEKFFIHNPEVDKKFLETGGLIFSTKKERTRISDNLIAYVYNSYLLDLEQSEDDENVSNIISSHSFEIEFLNTKILSFDEFCENIMLAQKFSGKHDSSVFKFSFIGYGNFSLEEYIQIHKIVSFSNLHLVDFFIKNKNVVSSIAAFTMGLYRNDVMRQREYLSQDEFRALLDESERHFALMTSLLA